MPHSRQGNRNRRGTSAKLLVSPTEYAWLVENYWDVLECIRYNQPLVLPPSFSKRPDTERRIKWGALSATVEAAAHQYYSYRASYDVQVSRVIELHDFIKSFPGTVTIQAIITAYRMRFSNLEFRRSLQKLGFSFTENVINVSYDVRIFQRIAEIIQTLDEHGIDINVDTVLCAIDSISKPLTIKQLIRFRRFIEQYLMLRNIAHPLRLPNVNATEEQE